MLIQNINWIYFLNVKIEYLVCYFFNILCSSNLTVLLPQSDYSLMESFVPFGGFFSMPSEIKGPLRNPQCVTRCRSCDEKCEQEVRAISKGGFTFSMADQYQSSLPPWLRMKELGASKASDVKVCPPWTLQVHAKFCFHSLVIISYWMVSPGIYALVLKKISVLPRFVCIFPAAFVPRRCHSGGHKLSLV